MIRNASLNKKNIETFFWVDRPLICEKQLANLIR
jgi:hypothetical protein